MGLILGKEMIFDIHTHIVPGIDDGARNFEESVQLIERAREQGVRSIIATPHYYLQKPSNPDVIRRSVEKLNAKFSDVSIYTGNEVMYFESMVEKLKSGEILTLADSKFVLIEFYPDESYKRIVRAVQNLRFSGYYPIIAHVERFRALKEEGLSGLIELGAYLQMSFSPVGENIFNKDCRFLRRALKAEEIHFTGSDMHRIDRRPPVITSAVKWMEKNLNNVQSVLYKNAEKIIANCDFLNQQ